MHIYTCGEAKIKYDELIESNRSTERVKFKTERHHIIPKSHNGSNDPSNLVNLRHKDHFIAHYLLWVIHRDEPMAYAFFSMFTFKQKRELSEDLLSEYSEIYQILRSQCGIINSKRIITNETREKISVTHKGKSLTTEHKQKISSAKLGKPISAKTEKHKQKISESLKLKKIKKTPYKLKPRFEYNLQTPEGSVITIYKINDYCKEIGLCYSKKRLENRGYKILSKKKLSEI